MNKLCAYIQAKALQETKDLEGDEWLKAYSEKLIELTVIQAVDIITEAPKRYLQNSKLSMYNTGWCKGRILAADHLVYYFLGIEAFEKLEAAPDAELNLDIKE
jgi:hypothetical protein